jgi:hypothetical protein
MPNRSIQCDACSIGWCQRDLIVNYCNILLYNYCIKKILLFLLSYILFIFYFSSCANNNKKYHYCAEITGYAPRPHAHQYFVCYWYVVEHEYMWTKGRAEYYTLYFLGFCVALSVNYTRNTLAF